MEDGEGEHDVEEGELFEELVWKVSQKDLRKRIDEYRELANAEYTFPDGTKVRALPQFRYAWRGDSEDAKKQVSRILGAKFEKRHPKAIHMAAYGRAKPSEVAAITQGLIDAGELDSVRKDRPGLADDQLVRALQRKFRIGIDCAGYVQLAFIYSLTGSDNDNRRIRRSLGLHERRGYEGHVCPPGTGT